MTSLERCRATAVKPIVSNRPLSFSGSGWANSTNSMPSVPMGLESLIAAGPASCGNGPMMISSLHHCATLIAVALLAHLMCDRRAFSWHDSDFVHEACAQYHGGA